MYWIIHTGAQEALEAGSWEVEIVGSVVSTQPAHRAVRIYDDSLRLALNRGPQERRDEGTWYISPLTTMRPDRLSARSRDYTVHGPA